MSFCLPIMLRRMDQVFFLCHACFRPKCLRSNLLSYFVWFCYIMYCSFLYARIFRSAGFCSFLVNSLVLVLEEVKSPDANQGSRLTFFLFFFIFEVERFFQTHIYTEA